MAVVGTGNHYIFDGIVGLVVCAVALLLAIALQRVGYPRIRGWLGAWAGVSAADRRLGPEVSR